MSDLYRDNAKVGSGSSAAAHRFEVVTGQAVRGKTHAQKLRDYSAAVEAWLKKAAVNQAVARTDVMAAEMILLDMRNALNGRSG